MVVTLPEDWRTVAFSNIADIRDGTHDTPQAVDNGFPLVTSKCLKNGRIDYSVTYNISREDYDQINQRSKVDVGDILYAMIGTIGNPVLIEKKPRFAIKNVALFKPYNKKLSSFLKHYLDSPLFERELENLQNGSNQSFISLSSFRSMIFVLPEKEEQTAIAEALSDADRLIASLEKLIAKKKAIKQGAMQELLTGKKRLPGFSGEWETGKIGEVALVKDGTHGTFTRVKIGVLLLSAKNIVDRKIELTEESYVSNEDYFEITNNGFPRSGDILLSCVGSIGRCCIYFGLPKAAFQRSVAFIRCKSVDNGFLSYKIQSEPIQKQLMQSANASAQGGVYLGAIKNIEVIYPSSKAEQAAIATILSDMDAEIEQLEKKLAKYRLIKQGMMQELLTGRIRLVESAKQANVIEMVKGKPASKGHNPKYDDAIAISAIVNAFHDDRFVLGRVKVQKLLYLLRRKQDADVSAFKKKAAGPYNEKVRYNGGESIAIKEGYVVRQSGNAGSKFSKGMNIGVALQYVGSTQADIDWLLEKFRYYNTNENKDSNNLEVLATVDMAVCELDKIGQVTSVDAVKGVIRSNKEWAPKLKKPCFTDAAIQKAIEESEEFFG